MMSNTHTPGPWAAQINAEDAGSTHRHWIIADNAPGSHLPALAANEADAALIAAAPDMLSALKGLVSMTDPADSPELAAAYAAIAKAEGK